MTEENKKIPAFVGNYGEAKETTPMDIKVLGSGCPTCKKLYNLVSRVAKEAGIMETVTYVPDIQEVLKLKVLKTPVITIRGKVVMTGFEIEPEEAKKEKIKKILLDNK
ncbi:MAG: thioredoxin family protein [Candidatus Paceibacterota bacterium]